MKARRQKRIDNNLMETEQLPDRQLTLRLMATDAARIEAAAKYQGVDAAEFIFRSACEVAERTLTKQVRPAIENQQWKEFMDALDRAPREKPRLRRLFAEDHVAGRRS